MRPAPAHHLDEFDATLFQGRMRVRGASRRIALKAYPVESG